MRAAELLDILKIDMRMNERHVRVVRVEAVGGREGRTLLFHQCFFNMQNNFIVSEQEHKERT